MYAKYGVNNLTITIRPKYYRITINTTREVHIFLRTLIKTVDKLSKLLLAEFEQCRLLKSGKRYIASLGAYCKNRLVVWDLLYSIIERNGVHIH
jgi:hypothetical protein